MEYDCTNQTSKLSTLTNKYSIHVNKVRNSTYYNMWGSNKFCFKYMIVWTIFILYPYHHSSSSLSSSSVDSINSLHGLLQSSLPMQEQAPVQGMSLHLQAQRWFCWHADFWHLHVVNSRSPKGAGSFNMSSGWGPSSVACQPFPSGSGSLCLASRDLFQMNAW